MQAGIHFVHRRVMAGETCETPLHQTSKSLGLRRTVPLDSGERDVCNAVDALPRFTSSMSIRCRANVDGADNQAS